MYCGPRPYAQQALRLEPAPGQAVPGVMTADSQMSRMGFVLAGGRSSRMGADKAFLSLGGRTLIDRARDALLAVCRAPGIVGDRAELARYDGVISDVFPGCGPLGGIHAAVCASHAELNVILAVDMPLVTRELLTFLLSIAENNRAVVTAPRTGRGWQPLCAVYRPEFAPAAEKALREGNYKIDALFSRVETCPVHADELSAAGFSERNFFNVNTPEELKEIVDF